MAWHSKSRPAGFVSPAIPVVRPKPPTGSGWLHEIKFDGYRLIARRDGTALHLWSRNAAEYAGTMSRIVAGLRELRAKSVTIDGEVSFDGLFTVGTIPPASLLDIRARFLTP